MPLPLYLTLDLLFLISEVFLYWQRRASRVQSNRQDRGSLLLLWVVISSAITLAHLAAGRGLGPLLPSGLPWGWIGAAIFAAGAVLRWWSIIHLGRFFSVDVAVAADHRVIRTGPYGWVRHPSYTGLLLECAGIGLALFHLASLLVLLVPTFLALNYRISVEEGALLQRLGEDYASYRRSTKRLLPGIY